MPSPEETEMPGRVEFLSAGEAELRRLISLLGSIKPENCAKLPRPEISAVKSPSPRSSVAIAHTAVGRGGGTVQGERTEFDSPEETMHLTSLVEDMEPQSNNLRQTESLGVTGNGIGRTTTGRRGAFVSTAHTDDVHMTTGTKNVKFINDTYDGSFGYNAYDLHNSLDESSKPMGDLFENQNRKSKRLSTRSADSSPEPRRKGYEPLNSDVVTGGGGTALGPTFDESAIQQCASMGFEREKVIRALNFVNGNVQLAIDRLLSGEDSPEPPPRISDISTSVTSDVVIQPDSSYENQSPWFNSAETMRYFMDPFQTQDFDEFKGNTPTAHSNWLIPTFVLVGDRPRMADLQHLADIQVCYFFNFDTNDAELFDYYQPYGIPSKQCIKVPDPTHDMGKLCDVLKGIVGKIEDDRIIYIHGSNEANAIISIALLKVLYPDATLSLCLDRAKDMWKTRPESVNFPNVDPQKLERLFALVSTITPGSMQRTAYPPIKRGDGHHMASALMY